jgi:hypothetical protein
MFSICLKYVFKYLRIYYFLILYQKNVDVKKMHMVKSSCKKGLRTPETWLYKIIRVINLFLLQFNCLKNRWLPLKSRLLWSPSLSNYTCSLGYWMNDPVGYCVLAGNHFVMQLHSPGVCRKFATAVSRNFAEHNQSCKKSCWAWHLGFQRSHKASGVHRKLQNPLSWWVSRPLPAWRGRCHHIHEWIMNYSIGCDHLPLRDLGNRHFIATFPEMSQASLILGMFNGLVCGCCGCLQLFCINDASKTFH